MKHFEKIVILCGGQSGERDVSLHSAEPVFEALKKMYPTQLLRLDVNVLPTDLNPESDLLIQLAAKLYAICGDHCGDCRCP